ncbi:alpha/beta fold hydrolase [uncultured Thiodictyon sp.]|uniref:alpha/beta fold hydrolase n=1 Tax=uncultured Thiodictyon sp. TaxID=1846217 RepID=UPI0025E0BED0|nr:alpha/beta fold hydrolase [uncultured Thiodictyon sp.]
MSLRLHHRHYGEASAGALPLLLIHGLFGSAANWHGIARRLANDRPVLVPDLRNHGQSPWDARMDYRAMAADLAALLDGEGIARAHLVGHSMGGKAAMWLALSAPERVGSLVVVDIAPVTYATRHGALVSALAALPLAQMTDRRAADALLAQTIHSAAVRGYLLQNLVHDRAGGWCWRVNLAVLAHSLDQVLGFPAAGDLQFPGPVLFLYGSRSDYVTGEGLPRIRALFPLARLRTIANAGHWVYADQPDEFLAAVSGFLKD